MNQEKINQIPWTEKLSVRVNMVVSYQNGYYRSLTGKNDGLPPEGNQNWTYLGEISRFETFARRDASNIMSDDADAWKLALGLDGFDIDEFMKLVDWTINGKIRTDKLESIALSRAIPVAETSIDDFLPNAGNYDFEEGDFIAIAADANPNPNYTLYYYTGGDRHVRESYLKTGLSNITMSMVDGLIDALNSKLDGPLQDGNWILKRDGGQFTWITHPLDKLNDVTVRGSYSSKPISFLSSSSTPDTGSPIGAIGVHGATYSYYFGDFNQAATGLYNISISYGALQKVTTGEYNIGIGVFAGKEITTGKSNTLLGSLTGQKITTGNFNLMAGRQAGNENTTGYKNTYFGTYAGYSNTTSNFNVLIGYKAGNQTAMGDRNLFLGSFSGQGVSGTNNIIFGVGAGFNDGAISNKLIIHNNQTLSGYGPDDTQEGVLGSPQQGQLNRALITGDFVDRWVRMNASYLQVGNPATNANNITILSGVGIRAAQLFNPTNDNDYVQKGWVGSNFIPLAGNTVAKPVTGDIYINQSVKIIHFGNINYNSSFTLEDGGFGFEGTGGTGGADKFNFFISQGQHLVFNSNFASSKGITSDRYFGANYDDNSFVQKKYVDDRIPSGGSYIPLAGNNSTNPVTGRLFFKGSTESIFFDYNPNELGTVTSIDINGISVIRAGYDMQLQSGVLIMQNATGQEMNVGVDTGITSQKIYNQNNDGDFVQKKHVDDRFIPLAGNPNNKPITGRLNFKGVEGSPIMIDYSEQQVGASQRIGLDGYVHTANGATININSSAVGINDDSTGDVIYMSTNGGVQASKYYPPSVNEDFIQKKYVDDRDKAIKPYKCYVCLMQAGGTPTPSPAFVELENSLGAIVWTRTNVGEYFGTLNGAFPIHKVVCFAQMAQGNGGIGPMKVITTARLDDNRVFIKMQDATDGTPYEANGQWGSLEIRVYP